jgi:glycosyltransferase involved in cell wall biosynthesis
MADATTLFSPHELHGRDLLCFSHDWTGDPLSKTHLMRLLAKRNRVLWVNSIGYRTPSVNRSDLSRIFKKLSAAMSPLNEVEPNLFVLNPLVIPAYGSQWIRKANQKWLRFQVRRAMQRLNFSKPINFVFNPAAGMVAGTLDEAAIVYYCVDEYTAFSGVSSASLAALEQGLMAKADLVVVSSQPLYLTKSRIHPATVLVRHGVDVSHFRKALDIRTNVPRELRDLPKPIIGYFGLIAQDWVDVDLLVHVAKAMPEASLVMLGKVTMDVSALQDLPNVHLLGRKPYAHLPAYCRGFDVAVIPFPISPVTLAANPLKAREYLAAGLPVVSTAIPEVEVLGQCRIGFDRDSFVEHIRAALNDPAPRIARSDMMHGESWAARLAIVERHLLARRPDLRSAPAQQEALCKAA